MTRGRRRNAHSNKGQSIELVAFSKTTLFGLCFQKTSCYRIINLGRQLHEASTTERGAEIPDGAINEQHMFVSELGSGL